MHSAGSVLAAAHSSGKQLKQACWNEAQPLGTQNCATALHASQAKLADTWLYTVRLNSCTVTPSQVIMNIDWPDTQSKMRFLQPCCLSQQKKTIKQAAETAGHQNKDR